MSIFDVKKEKFIDIFNNKNSFEIPEYQRPYSWEEKQLNDLWDDVLNATNREYKEYLLGTVYLERISDRNFKILDGQQRFISMYLLLKVLRVDYLPTLTIGINDNDFFQDLVSFKGISPSSASQKRLKIALELFKNKVTNENGILNFIQNNLSIIVTIVKDSEVAITTFITQTDRGKRLTNLEKLKSILYYYNLQMKDTNLEMNTIEKLFGEMYQSLNKLYNKPETSEADVLRVLMIRLEQDDSYRGRGNEFKKLNKDNTENKENIERITSWESGEDEIFSWIQRVLFGLKDANLIKALERIIYILKEINRSLNYYSENFAKQADLKSIFLSLNPSRFSRAFLVDYLNEKKDLFEKKFEVIDSDEKLIPKLEKINIPVVLHKYLDDTETRIKEYKEEFKQKNILNLIERLELSCWKIWKRPLGRFLNYQSDKAEEHLINFANEHKKSYFLRDFGYGNYRYILMAYEAYHNAGFKIEDFYSVMSESNEITKVHREHIFAQNPDNEISKKIIEEGFGENKASYDKWIWNIGNITLLSEGVNISESNNTPWKKANGYIIQENFTTTRTLGEDILKYCKVEEQYDLNLLKSMLEIREYELKMFAWYRF